VDDSWGGIIDRFFLATYKKGNPDRFVPRDIAPLDLFDSAVVYWWNIPNVPQSKKEKK
jgi:hypothetical protein